MKKKTMMILLSATVLMGCSKAESNQTASTDENGEPIIRTTDMVFGYADGETTVPLCTFTAAEFNENEYLINGTVYSKKDGTLKDLGNFPSAEQLKDCLMYIASVYDGPETQYSITIRDHENVYKIDTMQTYCEENDVEYFISDNDGYRSISFVNFNGSGERMNVALIRELASEDKVVSVVNPYGELLNSMSLEEFSDMVNSKLTVLG